MSCSNKNNNSWHFTPPTLVYIHTASLDLHNNLVWPVSIARWECWRVMDLNCLFDKYIIGQLPSTKYCSGSTGASILDRGEGSHTTDTEVYKVIAMVVMLWKKKKKLMQQNDKLEKNLQSWAGAWFHPEKFKAESPVPSHFLVGNSSLVWLHVRITKELLKYTSAHALLPKRLFNYTWYLYKQNTIECGLKNDSACFCWCLKFNVKHGHVYIGLWSLSLIETFMCRQVSFFLWACNLFLYKRRKYNLQNINEQKRFLANHKWSLLKM